MEMGNICFESNGSVITAIEGETSKEIKCVWVSLRESNQHKDDAINIPLTPWQARQLSRALEDYAEAIEKRTTESD